VTFESKAQYKIQNQKEVVVMFTLDLARVMVRSIEQDWAKANGRRTSRWTR